MSLQEHLISEPSPVSLMMLQIFLRAVKLLNGGFVCSEHQSYVMSIRLHVTNWFTLTLQYPDHLAMRARPG